MASTKMLLAFALFALFSYGQAEDCAMCYWNIEKYDFLTDLIDPEMENKEVCIENDVEDPEDDFKTVSGSMCYYCVVLDDDGEAESAIRGVWDDRFDLGTIEQTNEDKDKVFVCKTCDNKDVCNSAVSHTVGFAAALLSLVMVKLF